MNFNNQSSDEAVVVKSDTLSILLTSRLHSHLDDKARSIKIAKCCKIIRDRTNDEVLLSACRGVIKANSNGKYAEVVRAISMTEYNYFLEYKSND